jgi:tripartite-type tricarboxylate transporter receptor subunit TctC
VPLAVTSANRSPLVPEVPSVVEFGYRRLVLDNFFRPVRPGQDAGRRGGADQCRLQRNPVQADVRKRMVDLGITASAASPAAFAGFVREQVAQLAPTVKGAGVKL